MGDTLSSKEIGARIKEFRKGKGLTREELAEKVGVVSGQIQKYENGQDRMNTDKLQAVAHALSIPVAAIFDEVESLLSSEEEQLVKAFRKIPNPEIKAFILKIVS